MLSNNIEKAPLYDTTEIDTSLYDTILFQHYMILNMI